MTNDAGSPKIPPIHSQERMFKKTTTSLKKSSNFKSRESSDGNPVYLTAGGLKNIREQLEYLRKDKTREVATRIADARDFGGQEENSEFDAAREEEVLLEAKIATLEQVIKHAKIIQETHENKISLGSTVTLELDGKKQSFTIVGKMEANPTQKRISNESPIGMALLGAQIGQRIEVKTPALRYFCKVLEIG